MGSCEARRQAGDALVHLLPPGFPSVCARLSIFCLQEWRAVSVDGDAQVAARAGGHIIAADGAGGLWLFGGTDAMGGQAGNLLRLRQKAGSPRWVGLVQAVAPQG